MTRNIFIFIGTFVVGSLIALVTRAALFNPHRGHEGHPAKAEYAPMVSNPLAPTVTPAPGTVPAAASAQPAGKPAPVATPSTSDPHAGHGAVKTAATPTGATVAATADQPVNTVCAICGMDVDPKLPTLEYQGKKIGFGCKMCAPKFKADPDRYGPAYLRNEIIKN